MTKFILAAVGVALASIVGAMLSPTSTHAALQVERSCTNIETVFARGSGSDIGKDESSKFFASINDRLTGSKITRATYELGTETYGGHKYPAIQVGQAPYGNALGAKVSGGYANDYGKSVDAGVGELYNYLTQRYEKCKSSGTWFVLGGYSQGAQVIGQTLPKFTTELRAKILYSAFFGDPKLHLPEGEGWNPPACQGKNLSTYRRVIANCDVDNGSLGARKPYLPNDMQFKSGLWCYNKDYVCGVTHNVFDNSGHSTYKNDGLAIDQAALEVATRLKQALPFSQQDAVDTKPRGNASGKPDVVYIIDTTGSMSGRIEQTKAFIRASSARIQALNGRVALVAYRDLGDEYTAKVIAPLSGDLLQFRAGLDSLTVGGGGDWYEAGNHALMTAFNSLQWQDGAAKAAVLLTDAPSHNPDKVDGSTVESVAKRSLEIDPVNVYPVVPGDVAPTYQQLAELTSGQVITDTGDTEEALTQALTKIEQRPVAVLKNTLYRGEVGQEFTFDASDSFIVDSTITSYEWDFNGDGTFDATTTTPTISHTYSQKFDGTMQVRLHGANSTIASASAFVKIGTYIAPVLPAAPTNVSATVLSTTDNKSTVRLAWAANTTPEKWTISVNDTVLGSTSGSQTSIEISDIDRSIDTTFSVAGLAADGTLGHAASTVLAKTDTSTPPGTKSCLLSGLAGIFNTIFQPFITIKITC